MNELDRIIKETVDEYLQQVSEYGPRWNSRLDQALTELESLMKSHEDPPFAELLLQVKDTYGLSDYEAFMVGENSSYPTSDEFWQLLGPSYFQFIGGYDDSVSEDLPLSGDEKYIKQQQTDTAPMPLNVANATWREGEENAIQVPGYGMVPLEQMKSRLRQMFSEAIQNLDDGRYGNLNHDFGLNSVGSSFITTLTKYYDEQSSAVQ